MDRVQENDDKSVSLVLWFGKCTTSRKKRIKVETFPRYVRTRIGFVVKVNGGAFLSVGNCYSRIAFVILLFCYVLGQKICRRKTKDLVVFMCLELRDIISEQKNRRIIYPLVD